MLTLELPRPGRHIQRGPREARALCLNSVSAGAKKRNRAVHNLSARRLAAERGVPAAFGSSGSLQDVAGSGSSLGERPAGHVPWPRPPIF
ncbi:hypothetical protein NDU88_006319 [Pleurodeles waltl]|uniref:Uncharacterized protein n=1 Tax=Pleurodeles waltl TaxID=8319 RepID=A0AAV7QIE0_PLEWA|nr:hypothetical protein NDU88_006319 [Pleurodeles waltl]